MTDVARDRWGRYLIMPPGGAGGSAKPYTRATTISGTLSDKYGLELWGKRMVALGLAARHDLYAMVSSTDPDDKKALNKLCEEALAAAKSSEKANWGTALHADVARINMRIPALSQIPEVTASLKLYSKTLEQAGIEVHRDYVERVVVLDSVQVAGTFDMLVTLPDGTDCIADLKTGQSLDFAWHEIAIQLALYAHADNIYSYETGFRAPMPTVRTDIGLIVHLPAGGDTCTLHTVDLEAGWYAADLALKVRDWRKRKNIVAAYTHHGPKMAPDHRKEALRRRVEQIRDLGHLPLLADRWPADIPGFKTDHPHTHAELLAIALIVDEIEKEKGLPF